MTEPGLYFTYREDHHNLFKNYEDQKVRVTVIYRKKKNRVYVGVFKAIDLEKNVVLAYPYRVILNGTEEQCQPIEGLMIIRGSFVKTIVPENKKRPPVWKVKPMSESKAIEKNRIPKKLMNEPIKTPDKPTTSTKVIKLKRSWLANCNSSQVNPSTSTQTQEVENIMVKKEREIKQEKEDETQMQCKCQSAEKENEDLNQLKDIKCKVEELKVEEDA